MFTLAQTRETLLRHATNATGDRSFVDAVDARWQICSMGDTQTPASRRVQDWVLQERGRGNSGWPCHLLDRAGLQVILSKVDSDVVVG